MECGFCGSETEGKNYCPYCGTSLTADGAVCDESTSEDFTYEAFISYRHTPSNRAMARKIQRSIEGYKIPQHLVSGEKKALGKCFRDEDELPTATSLPQMIEDALEHSRFLIVICSPDMRESQWCAREIETFAQLHGRDRILLALVEGEPDEAFPPLLQTIKKLDDNGNIVEVECEPVAADFRKETGKKYADEILRVISPLVGCGYDDIKQRERARHTKRLLTGAAVIVAVSVLFAGFSIYQQIQIRTNLNAAYRNQSTLQAEQSNELYLSGRSTQAIMVALDALGETPGSSSRPYVPAARLALEQACNIYPRYISPYSSWFRQSASEEEGVVEHMAVNEEGTRYVVTDDLGNVSIYDTETGIRLFALDKEATGLEGAVSNLTTINNMAICQYRGLICAIDLATGERAWFIDLKYYDDTRFTSCFYSVDAIFATSNSQIIAATLGGDAYEIAVLDANTGSVVQTFTTVDRCLGSLNKYEYSDTTRSIYSFGGDALIRFDLETGELTTVPCTRDSFSGDFFVGRDFIACISGQEEQNVASVYDPQTLELLWSSEFSVPLSVFNVCNFLGECAVEGRPSLVFQSEYTLVYLSKDSGDVLRTEEMPSYPVSFAFYEENGRQFRIGVLEDGSLIGRIAVNEGEYGTNLRDWYTWDDLSSGIKDAVFFEDANGNMKLLVQYLASDQEASPRCVAMVAHQEGWSPYEAEPREYEPKQAGIGEFSVHSCDGSYIADHDDDSVLVADGEAFETKRVFSFEELGIDNYPGLAFSPREDNILYVYERERIAAVDVSSEEILGVTNQPLEYDKLPTVGSFACVDSDGYLIVTNLDDSYNLILNKLDPRTLEVVEQVAFAPSDEKIPEGVVKHAFAYYVAGSVLYCIGSGIGSGDVSQVAAVDINTGQLIKSVSFNVYDGLWQSTISKDGHIAFLVAEGALQCYDETGALMWEKDFSVGDSCNLAFLEDDTILAENADGTLMLLDGKTGEEIARDENTSLSNWFSGVWEFDDHIYISRTAIGEGCSGIAGICRDKDSFGIESFVPTGAAISKDGMRVLTTNGYYEWRVYPLFTTDELVEYAQGLCEGHELTAAERERYGL